MNSSAALLAPFALILPSLAGGPRDGAPAKEVVQAAQSPDIGGKIPVPPSASSPPEPFRHLAEAYRSPVERQVRIEQRVVIRIAPGGPAQREGMPGELPQPIRENYAHQPIEGCVPIEAIAGVQPVPQNRVLLLFMRDRRVLSAALERSCNAADFYSGFYVERQEDGALCSHRDRLQSRAGASCQVTQFSRLVAVRD